MKLRTFALAGLAFIGAAAPAMAAETMPPPVAGHTCLRNIDIWNFNAQNDKTLILESRSHAKYKVSMMGTCSGLRFTEHLEFKTLGSTSLSCLERGDQVITHEVGIRGVCSIMNVEPYTPEMQAADKAAAAARKAAASN